MRSTRSTRFVFSHANKHSLINDKRIQKLFTKLSPAAATGGADGGVDDHESLASCANVVRRNRRVLLLHELLQQHLAVLQLVAVCLNAELKLSISMLSPKERYVDKIVAIFRLKAPGELLLVAVYTSIYLHIVSIYIYKYEE